jgi:hypothetical protein
MVPWWESSWMMIPYGAFIVASVMAFYVWLWKISRG